MTASKSPRTAMAFGLLAFLATPAAAGDAVGGMEAWTPLPTTALAEQRAGAAIAESQAIQIVSQELTADTVTGGNISMGSENAANQKFAINVLNSGNNVAVLNTYNVAIYFQGQ